MKQTFNISRLKYFEGQQTISHSWRASFKTLLSSCITCRSDQNAIGYIIAESLILPAASNMRKTTFGKEKYVKNTQQHPFVFFPLSIDELAADVRAQLVAKLPKADYFALQLDESTDVSNDPQLLAFVWLSTKMRCRRNLYSVSSCMDVQKSSETFKVIDNFFREHDIP